MPDLGTLLYLYVETPLHAGVGRQTDAAVDLPIQREQPTGYPIVRASTLKGALRAQAARRPAAEVAGVFGPPAEAPESERFSGALALGDALPLLFPVRSLVGVFAWVTSLAVLARFCRDAAEQAVPLTWQIPEQPAAGAAAVPPESRVRDPSGRLTLEDLTFRADVDPGLGPIGRWLAEQALPADQSFAYWREKVQRDLVLVPEAVFRFFVAHSTEVAARIRIDPRTGAAAEGALWTEEALPADTLLYTAAVARDPDRPTETLKTAADCLRWLRELLSPRLQVGGSRTLGRGFVRVQAASGSPDGGPR